MSDGMNSSSVVPGAPSFQPFSLLQDAAGPSKSSGSRARSGGPGLLAESDRPDPPIAVGAHSGNRQRPRAGAANDGGRGGDLEGSGGVGDRGRQNGKKKGKKTWVKEAGQPVGAQYGAVKGGVRAGSKPPASTGTAKKSQNDNHPADNQQKKGKKKNKRKNKNKNANTNGTNASDNLAVQVFQEPLLRLAILGNLNPFCMDDLKSIISLKQLGLLPTEELRYYLNTCVPDQYVALDVGISMLGHGDFGERELSTQMMAWLGLDAQAMRYFLHEKMDVGELKDVLREDVLNVEPPSARKWLQGKSRAAIWRKYGFLSYIPKDVYNCFRDGQKGLRMMQSKEFKRERSALTQAEMASQLLDVVVAAGCSIEVIYKLISEYFADIEAPACGCIDPRLRTAAINGHTHIVKYLVESCGCDPMRVSTHEGGNSMAHFAARSGRIETLRYVCGTLGVNPDTTNGADQTPMHSAAVSGSVACVKYLADECGLDGNAKDHKGHTPAMYAAMGGYLGLLEVFANEYGYDMRAVDVDGGNVLHWAMTKGHVHLIKPLVETYNLDVNASTQSGQTALHYAVMSRSKEALRALIDEHGANPKAVTRCGATLAHFAAAYFANPLLPVLFEKYKIDPMAKAEDGETCLDWAIARGNTDGEILLEEDYGMDGMDGWDFGDGDIDLDDVFGLSVNDYAQIFGVDPLTAYHERNEDGLTDEELTDDEDEDYAGFGIVGLTLDQIYGRR